jgi:hypothetical protein
MNGADTTDAEVRWQVLKAGDEFCEANQDKAGKGSDYEVTSRAFVDGWSTLRLRFLPITEPRAIVDVADVTI